MTSGDTLREEKYEYLPTMKACRKMYPAAKDQLVLFSPMHPLFLNYISIETLLKWVADLVEILNG